MFTSNAEYAMLLVYVTITDKMDLKVMHTDSFVYLLCRVLCLPYLVIITMLLLVLIMTVSVLNKQVLMEG